jgi:hypothetical protein
MQQLGCHWTDFCEVLYLNIFRKSIEKIQDSLKSGKNKAYFTGRPTYFMIISRSFLRRMKNVSHIFVEVIKTHILISLIFFILKSYCLGDNVEKYCRAGQATYDNMAHAH